MIDGTYAFEVDTPLGRKFGTVKIATTGSTALAEIDMPVVGKHRMEGRAEGDTFTAEGVFKKALLGKVSFTLRGEVVGDDLNVHIASNKGDFALVGVRI